MCMEVSTIATEPLLHYPIHNAAMSGHMGAGSLFYLEGRKVSFRCCPIKDFNSDNQPTLFRIQACFSDTFDPERMMGEALGEALGMDIFKLSFCEGNLPVTITTKQIPIQLAERIQAIATSQLSIVDKYKIIQPPHPKGMCVALTKEQVQKFEERDQEIAQLNVVKEELGREFKNFATSQGISLSY